MTRNKYLHKFMEQFLFEGLTFDDVSLITQYADFLPPETIISSRFTRNVSVNMPFISAAMDTVTESKMAIAMAMQGGMGVIHKNLDVADQAANVARVKHYLNGLIAEPVTFRNTDKLDTIYEAKSRAGYSFNGFPILDENGKIVGMLSSRDIKFAKNKKAPLSDIMAKNVITAPEGTSLKKAHEIMRQNRVGKLPIINADGKLVGLYSFSDVNALVEKTNPIYNRDSQHRLRVAAAVSPYDFERAEALKNAEVDVMVIDTAHGHSKGVIEMCGWVKANCPGIDVVGGNIASGEAAKSLLDAGADAVKVGIGPGSICTTRVVAGVGVPQISAIYDTAQALGGEIPVIADGGIRHSGDVAKAIVAGADTVMMGSVLAGTDESPGEKIIYQGRSYVVYRGMGSLDAMKSREGSRERYGLKGVEEEDLVPQGIEGMVPFAGKVKSVLTQYCGGLQASLGYCGTRNLDALHERGKFVRVSTAGFNEAHPHDIKITKEAPNYRS